MKLEDLEKKLGVSSTMSNEDKLALIKDIQANLPALKAEQVTLQAKTQANLVVEAIKKIKSDLEARYQELSQDIANKAANITSGKDGLQGPKGEKGDRGFDGVNGKDGRDGKDGKDGVDGSDGVGVADAHIDFDGALVITLTNGKEINAGEVLPLDTAEKLKVYFQNPSLSGTTYPDAGIAVSTGTAWGTSLTAPTGSIVGTTDTQTLTNKNIVERVVAIADGTSITINADTTDIATQANTQATGTLTINAPTGTPVNGQKLVLRLSSTSVQTFSWNAIFAGSTDLALPTASSSGGKYDYVGFIYNSTAAKWQLLAKVFGF